MEGCIHPSMHGKHPKHLKRGGPQKKTWKTIGQTFTFRVDDCDCLFLSVGPVGNSTRLTIDARNYQSCTFVWVFNCGVKKKPLVPFFALLVIKKRCPVLLKLPILQHVLQACSTSCVCGRSSCDFLISAR